MARREPRSDYEKLSKPELIEKLVDLERCRSETRLSKVGEGSTFFFTLPGH